LFSNAVRRYSHDPHEVGEVGASGIGGSTPRRIPRLGIARYVVHVSGFESAAITTERLRLEPLQVEDADEMAAVLGDERLHEFTGGDPLSLVDLRERYARLVAGSLRPDEVWLNWIVRRSSDSVAIGTVQATLTTRDGRSCAHVAWVIGVDWQGQGFASEAARALVGWLRRRGVEELVAHIHPEHRASAAVAARAGLRPTDDEVDGEQVWRD
jgi:RimJ/RimL family protein N-acetyltransferase